jgi:uncharacterized protein with HEPN domain
MPDDAATVLDIVLACRRIVRFTRDTDQISFLADDEKHWAVVSQLMLIGEAVRRLPTDFLDQHPTIPWHQIAGMRNRLIHHYDKIDWPLVWVSVRRDVPPLLAELEPLVPEPNDES